MSRAPNTPEHQHPSLHAHQHQLPQAATAAAQPELHTGLRSTTAPLRGAAPSRIRPHSRAPSCSFSKSSHSALGKAPAGCHGNKILCFHGSCSTGWLLQMWPCRLRCALWVLLYSTGLWSQRPRIGSTVPRSTQLRAIAMRVHLLWARLHTASLLRNTRPAAAAAIQHLWKH